MNSIVDMEEEKIPLINDDEAKKIEKIERTRIMNSSDESLLCFKCGHLSYEFPMYCGNCGLEYVLCPDCKCPICHDDDAKLNFDDSNLAKWKELLIVCKYPDCNSSHQYCNIQAHEKECPRGSNQQIEKDFESQIETKEESKREVYCQMCQENIPALDIENHNCIQFLKKLQATQNEKVKKKLARITQSFRNSHKQIDELQNTISLLNHEIEDNNEEMRIFRTNINRLRSDLGKQKKNFFPLFCKILIFLTLILSVFSTYWIVSGENIEYKKIREKSSQRVNDSKLTGEEDDDNIILTSKEMSKLISEESTIVEEEEEEEPSNEPVNSYIEPKIESTESIPVRKWTTLTEEAAVFISENGKIEKIRPSFNPTLFYLDYTLKSGKRYNIEISLQSLTIGTNYVDALFGITQSLRVVNGKILGYGINSFNGSILVNNKEELTSNSCIFNKKERAEIIVDLYQGYMKIDKITKKMKNKKKSKPCHLFKLKQNQDYYLYGSLLSIEQAIEIMSINIEEFQIESGKE